MSEMEFTPLDITWLDDQPLIQLNIPGDGHCLFHAICLGSHKAYRSAPDYDSRLKIVQSLRSELKDVFDKPISKKDKKTPYHYLCGGKLVEFGKAVQDYSFKSMSAQFEGSNYIGHGFIEFINNVLDKDIYILSDQTKDIYITHELPFTITGKRKSLILNYVNNNHYLLVGYMKENGSIITCFSPSGPLICKLYQRVRQIIEERKW